MYVLPSVSAVSLPTVVLEAMACEKVVVGYKNGGICEMVSDRESGYLEVIGANEKLSDDIEEIYLNDELYKSMAKCSAKRLNNMFSLHMFHKKIDDLYQRV